jgi:hypothetical protein
VIEDFIQGSEESVSAYLHFHPDVKVEKVDDQTFHTESLIFSFSNSDSIRLEKYEYCDGFNKRRDSNKITIKFKEKLNTIIEPRSAQRTQS